MLCEQFYLFIYKLYISLICSIFHILISCIKFGTKTQEMHFGFMNVISLDSDHRHVSATHVANFRKASTRIQIYLWCVGITAQLESYISG